jgi:hypothetical protein
MLDRSWETESIDAWLDAARKIMKEPKGYPLWKMCLMTMDEYGRPYEYSITKFDLD